MRLWPWPSSLLSCRSSAAVNLTWGLCGTIARGVSNLDAAHGKHCDIHRKRVAPQAWYGGFSIKGGSLKWMVYNRKSIYIPFIKDDLRVLTPISGNLHMATYAKNSWGISGALKASQRKSPFSRHRPIPLVHLNTQPMPFSIHPVGSPARLHRDVSSAG